MTIARVVPEGDVAIEGGKLVLNTGAAYVRQKLLSRFRFFLGEWFLDERQGVPYYRDVFIKDPDVEVIRYLFLRVLESVPEVIGVSRFDVVYDKTARTLRFDFEISVAGAGDLVVRPDDESFIIIIIQAE